MNVSCPDCRSIFRVDPAKVPPSGVRARCSVCSGVISIPAPSGQATPAGGNARSVTSGSEAPPPERPRPSQGQGWDAPAGSSAQRAAPAAAPPPAPRPAPAPPASAPPLRTEVPASQRPRPESAGRPTPTATATPPSPATGLPEFTPSPPTPVAPRPAPPARPAAAAPQPAAPFVPAAAPPRATAPTPPPPPATPPRVPQGGGDSGARRPLNPFLSKDPDQRAKRLARALVSDIITYHPAKHAEGLRDGTLKQLFREEIKKSFEEYIAQVGQQLAESTTYFQEALNEVLGAGKKIF
jgi:predicted Zn finger-like uncharacterized protein